MPHEQLTTNDRYIITPPHMAGRSNATIARRLGRHRATIGRELARNRDALGSYRFILAQPANQPLETTCRPRGRPRKVDKPNKSS